MVAPLGKGCLLHVADVIFGLPCFLISNAGCDLLSYRPATSLVAAIVHALSHRCAPIAGAFSIVLDDHAPVAILFCSL